MAASSVILWCNRCIYVLALIATILIIRREWRRDKKFHTVNASSQRTTKIWPLVEFAIRYSPSVILVLVAASLVLLEMNLFPYTCLVGLPLETSVKATSWVFIAFFQLARLYYSYHIASIHLYSPQNTLPHTEPILLYTVFGNAQVQSSTNHIRPYPDWLFIVLIVLGMDLWTYGLSLDLFSLSVDRLL